MHGANRLASNSLLECLVFGRRAALSALGNPAPPSSRAATAALDEPAPTAVSKRALWREAGLTRCAEGLGSLLESESLVVRLLAESALLRRESRGVHFRSDFPVEDAAFARRHVIVSREHEPRLETWS